jgi:hypothetical protein
VAAGPLDDAGPACRHRPAPDALMPLTHTRTASEGASWTRTR